MPQDHCKRQKMASALYVPKGLVPSTYMFSKSQKNIAVQCGTLDTALQVTSEHFVHCYGALHANSEYSRALRYTLHATSGVHGVRRGVHCSLCSV